MYMNGYSVRVVGGTEVPGGYVEMNHDQRYSLSLRNSNNERCDASVEIDGQHVGTWRIPGHRTITLERPANDDGHFTFYRLGSREGEQAGLQNTNDLGLVRVTFTPEVRPQPLRVDREEYTFPSAAAQSWSNSTTDASHLGVSESITASYDVPKSRLSAGGTGLSGHSGQRFGQAREILLDYSRQTVIHLRLVCKNGDGPRPLASHSTPVPPAVR